MFIWKNLQQDEDECFCNFAFSNSYIIFYIQRQNNGFSVFFVQTPKTFGEQDQIESEISKNVSVFFYEFLLFSTKIMKKTMNGRLSLKPKKYFQNKDYIGKLIYFT